VIEAILSTGLPVTIPFAIYFALLFYFGAPRK